VVSIMDVDFKRRKKVDGKQFKLLGVMGCKPCSEKWERALQKKNRKVRVNKLKGGYEVWVAK
jgi:hypothetical protein